MGLLVLCADLEGVYGLHVDYCLKNKLYNKNSLGFSQLYGVKPIYQKRVDDFIVVFCI